MGRQLLPHKAPPQRAPPCGSSPGCHLRVAAQHHLLSPSATAAAPDAQSLGAQQPVTPTPSRQGGKVEGWGTVAGVLASHPQPQHGVQLLLSCHSPLGRAHTYCSQHSLPRQVPHGAPLSHPCGGMQGRLLAPITLSRNSLRQTPGQGCGRWPGSSQLRTGPGWTLSAMEAEPHRGENWGRVGTGPAGSPESQASPGWG